MTGRSFHQDRQRLAYAFAGAAILMGLYLAWKRALEPGAYVVIGGFASMALLLLGVPVNPREYFDDPARDRRHARRPDDSGEVPRVEGQPGERDERSSARLSGGVDLLPGYVGLRGV